MLLEISLLTFQVAIVATAINFPFAILVGWLIGRKNIRGSMFLEILVSLPLALPPVVVGYALLIAFGERGPIGSLTSSLFGYELVFTWFAAAIAAAIVSFPLMVRSIIVSMSSIDDQLENSARALGAGPVRTFLTVTIPLSYHGIVAGLLLGFVRSLSEFGATIIVAGNIPGRTQTLPLALFSKIQLGENGEAVRLMIACIVLAIITLGVHHFLLSKSNVKTSK
jgi:molybdate transport system permease protein